MNTRSEKLNNAAATIAKIFEVCNYALIGVFCILFVMYLLVPNIIAGDLIAIENGRITFLSFPTNWVSVPETFGPSFHITVAVWMIELMAEGVLLAMIFRNVYLIFRTSAGKTKNSVGPTPFQTANVKLLRQIGLYAIAIPLVEVLAYGSLAILVGPGIFQEAGISVEYVVLGIVVLCLSQFFAYGVELQSDVDGLL